MKLHDAVKLTENMFVALMFLEKRGYTDLDVISVGFDEFAGEGPHISVSGPPGLRAIAEKERLRAMEFSLPEDPDTKLFKLIMGEVLILDCDLFDAMIKKWGKEWEKEREMEATP